LSFEIQELHDIIRVIILLSGKRRVRKSILKEQINKICEPYTFIEASDLDRTLMKMVSEGLIQVKGDDVQLTKQGLELSREWRRLFLKREPVIETVAGITDGSTTGLAIIISTFIAGLTVKATLFTALLTLITVALTNFSSFLLGGITEDLADINTLQKLINHSLSDIPDRRERERSFKLTERLFNLIQIEIRKSNVYSAILCSAVTLLSGGIPVAIYLFLTGVLGLSFSLALIGLTLCIFLAIYRSKVMRIHWKTILLETIMIVLIAVVASLLISIV